MALVDCPSCNKKTSDKAKTCPHCDYSGTKRQVQLHKWQAHRIKDVLWGLAPSNECVMCDQLFTTAHEARRHCRSAVLSGTCPNVKDSYKGTRTLQRVDEHWCHVCGEEVQGWTNIREHMGGHLREMCRETCMGPGVSAVFVQGRRACDDSAQHIASCLP